jgi:Domain of unknown function (DUF4276)
VSTELVFMLEEPSMKAFLESLLPRFLPSSVDCILIPHEGKSDLELSLPRKLRAWRKPETKFLVVRDQDAADCKVVKARLLEIAAATGHAETVVRIACRELEAWILGDLEAVAHAFDKPRIAQLASKRKYRNPDRLASPSNELFRLLGKYSKIAGAREVGAHIDVSRNRSRSFQTFIAAVQRLAGLS